METRQTTILITWGYFARRVVGYDTGLDGVLEWMTLSESTKEQVEIVRKTREIFKKTGVIPDPNRIDPSFKHIDITAVKLAKMLLRTPWKDLPGRFQSLRNLFTKQDSCPCSCLFRFTMLLVREKKMGIWTLHSYVLPFKFVCLWKWPLHPFFFFFPGCGAAVLTPQIQKLVSRYLLTRATQENR